MCMEPQGQLFPRGGDCLQRQYGNVRAASTYGSAGACRCSEDPADRPAVLRLAEQCRCDVGRCNPYYRAVSGTRRRLGCLKTSRVLSSATERTYTTAGRCLFGSYRQRQC